MTKLKLRRIDLSQQTELDISYLQDRLDFEEVLEALNYDISHVQGGWIMCHCQNTANHSNGDQNPSFGFNPETMRYNCFVCGGGSLLKLVRETLDLDDEEAVWFLQEMSTFEPSTDKKLVDKVNKIMHPVEQVNLMPELPDSAYTHAVSMVDSSHRGHELYSYLDERKISWDVAQEIKLGFDEAHWGITIPHWFDGKLRGWQTRHLLHEGNTYFCDTCGGTGPKYTNTKGFPKKNTLYLYDLAIGWQVNVVESPLSALYLWSMGIPNTVATFGSFSLEQADLLKKFPKVRIWPDNDPAGLNNLLRVLDTLRHAVDVTIVPVVDKPKGDPADVESGQLFEYLHSAYSPGILPLFKGKLPTLEQALANTKG